jgi:hypothetical protein
VLAEPEEHAVTLVCDTGALFQLAPGEAFAGRWGLALDRLNGRQ